MKYILFLFLLLPFLQLIWGCGSTTVDPNIDWASKIDSLSKRPSTFKSKFVQLNGHTYEENWQFEVGDSTLIVDNGNCPISYTLYNGGINGATTYKMWFSDPYVTTVRITIKRAEGTKAITSIQLNNHIFTNELISAPVEEVPVGRSSKIYTVKKGDTPLSVSRELDIPLKDIPNPLPIGKKIKH